MLNTAHFGEVKHDAPKIPDTRVCITRLMRNLMDSGTTNSNILVADRPNFAEPLNTTILSKFRVL